MTIALYTEFSSFTIFRAFSYAVIISSSKIILSTGIFREIIFSLISAEVNPYTMSFKEVIKILSVIFSSLVNTCSKSFVDRSEVIITTSFPEEQFITS